MKLAEIVAPSVHEDALLNKLINISKEHGIKDIYVTFTKLDKFVINTETRYNTPMGLYAYPLSYVLKLRIDRVPFANYAPYVWVFKQTTPADNLWNIKTDNPDIRERVIGAVKQHTGIELSTEITNNKQLWREMYKAIGTIAKPNKSAEDVVPYNLWGTPAGKKLANERIPVSAQAVLASKILLGADIQAVTDTGTGTIHSNEKNQAVFLTLDYLTVIQKFNNTLVADLDKESKLANGNSNMSYKERLHYATTEMKRDIPLESMPIPASVHARELVQYMWQAKCPSWPAAEKKIAKHPSSALMFATCIYGRRWPAGEAAIMSKPLYILQYALAMKHRWPEAESVPMKDPNYAADYAIRIIKDRWPEAEPSIMTNRIAWKKYKTACGMA